MAYRKINNNNVSRTRQQRAKFKSNRTTTTVSGRTPGSYYSRPSSRNCNPGEIELWGVCYDPATTTEIYRVGEGLSGPIPPEIGYLINLTFLNIRSNNLTGEIPSEIGNLTNLTWLDLSNNRYLTGDIPSNIGNLMNLHILRLSGNHDYHHQGSGFTGEIPSSIGNLTNLTQLTLHTNQFTGGIPESFGNLTNLNSLLLYNSGLTGIIPASVCNIIHQTGQIPGDQHYVTVGNNFTLACQGDVTQDDYFNILDVVTTVNRIVNNNNFTGYETWLADMNFDGNVNITDVVAMVQQLLAQPNVSSSDRNQLNQILNQVQGGRE